jgi:broad specificity phosphatase PhoE
MVDFDNTIIGKKDQPLSYFGIHQANELIERFKQVIIHSEKAKRNSHYFHHEDWLMCILYNLLGIDPDKLFIFRINACRIIGIQKHESTNNLQTKHN